MTRQDYNKIILNDLQEKKFFESFMNDDIARDIYDIIEEKMIAYPDLRFGQIFCNDIYPDYRSRQETGLNNVMDMLFYGCTCDPFYEEPEITVKRLRIEV